MKIIPAVFFQKTMNGANAAAKLPERLELFESELRAVVGGAPRLGAAPAAEGTTTYSGSVGWLDLQQADDCIVTNPEPCATNKFMA
jgi:hypothetical protein